MTKLTKTQQKQAQRARIRGEKQNATKTIGEGNPFRWETQRHQHDAWAKGYLRPRKPA